MNFFNKIKGAAINFRDSIISSAMIKIINDKLNESFDGAANVKELKSDKKNKTIVMLVSLNGEKEDVRLNLYDYSISKISKGKLSFKCGRIQTSRQWLNIVCDKVIIPRLKEGVEFKTPDSVPDRILAYFI